MIRRSEQTIVLSAVAKSGIKASAKCINGDYVYKMF